MKTKRLLNLVGAMALTLSDEIVGRANALAPRDEPAAAIALIGRSPGLTIRALSVDLELSHPATVRLVDRLVSDLLVTRQKSEADGRAVELRLTSQGSEIYQRILERREATLSEALASITDEEREMLGRIAEKVLLTIARDTAETSRICRFCDVEQCRTCPIDAVRCDQS